MKYIKKFESIQKKLDAMAASKLIEKSVVKNIGPVIEQLNERLNDLGIEMRFHNKREIKSKQDLLPLPIMRNHKFIIPCVVVNLSIKEGRNNLLSTVVNYLYPESTTYAVPVHKGMGVTLLYIIFINKDNMKYFKDDLSGSNLHLVIDQDECTSNSKVRTMVIEKILQTYKSMTDKYYSSPNEFKICFKEIIVNYLEGLLKLNRLISVEGNFKLISDSINSCEDAFKIYNIVKKENPELFKKLNQTDEINMASNLGELGF